MGLVGTAGNGGSEVLVPTQSYRPLLWLGCSRAIDLVNGAADGPGQDGIDESAFGYRVTVFNNADVDVQCHGVLGGHESASGGAYYPNAVGGAKDAGCTVGIDYPPYGGSGSNGGIWNFALGKSAPTVTYEDDDSHPMNGDIVSFAPADCTLLALSDDGTWVPAEWSKLFD